MTLAWYDPTNKHVSTDKNDPMFTPLGQLWPLERERGNKKFEPIRIRIMKEAYDLADKGDTEGYNAVKVMCSEVQELMQRKEWVGLTDDEFDAINPKLSLFQFHKAIEAKLKDKNT